MQGEYIQQCRVNACCLGVTFIFILLFWPRQVLVATHGIFVEACRIFRCAARTLCCGARASLVVTCRFALSRCGVQAPGRVGSVVVARGLCSLWHRGCS